MINIFLKWLRTYRLHFLLWGIFILWEVVVIGLFAGIFGHPVTYLAHYLLIIALFYLHAIFALPWALQHFKAAFWRIPLMAITELGILILLSYWVDLGLMKAGFLKGDTNVSLTLPYVFRTLYRGLYFLGFATGYYYLITFLRERKRIGELEKQHYLEIIKRQDVEEQLVKAQNAFLLAQINPHFFFNTLDFLYHNVIDLSPASAEAISSLATMMRFAIDADKIGDYIRLGDEVEQVENLIYLHQIRQPLSIDLQVDDAAREAQIIPLVLLTLAENMFKHGYLRAPGHQAKIRIWIDGRTLCIETVNPVGNQRHPQASHTGLINTARRLKNAYGDDVALDHGPQEDGSYRVRISLPVQVWTASAAFSYF